MKHFFIFLAIIIYHLPCLAQKIDSIFFHLYTDSLKKGTYNYINVDGKMSDGKWKPLSSKEIIFTTNYGFFEGNELVLPDTCIVDSVLVKAVLISQPGIWKEITIWIKKKPDDEILPKKEDILNKKSRSKNKPR